MSGAIPASDLVTDTMALVLRLEKRKLGRKAKSAFEGAEAGKTQVIIPSMVLAEILYLSEKKRISIGLVEVANYCSQFPHCQQYPLDFKVIQAAAEITDIQELHDRLIAGNARLLNLSLLTNDPMIQASKFVKTVW